MIDEESINIITELHKFLCSNNIKEYLGTKIFYSNFIYKPKYLFIGINPGADYFIKYFKNNNIKLCTFEEMDEGIHYKIYNSNIGDSINYIFNKSGREFFLNNSAMKINCHFQSTTDSNIFYNKLLGVIKSFFKNNYNNDYYLIQSKIILNLIKGIHPEYIICEGVAAFREFKKFMDILKININYSIDRIEYDILNEIQYIIFDNYYLTAIELPRVISGAIDKKWYKSAISWLKCH